jgi:hypothetical protein
MQDDPKEKNTPQLKGTQPQVVNHYFRLAVLSVNLNRKATIQSSSPCPVQE